MLSLLLYEVLVAEDRLGDRREAAGVVAQGVPVAMVERGDLAEVQRVVAPVVGAPGAALHRGQRTGDARGDLPLQPVHVDRRTTGEAACDALLLRPEDADRERLPLEGVMGTRLPGHAGQDERRAHGDRRERVDR